MISFVLLATVSRTRRTQGRPVSEFVRFPCTSCSLQWTRKLRAHVACALRSTRPRVALRVLSIQLRVLSTSNSASRHWLKDWNKTKGEFQNKILYLKWLTWSLLCCVRPSRWTKHGCVWKASSIKHVHSVNPAIRPPHSLSVNDDQ